LYNEMMGVAKGEITKEALTEFYEIKSKRN
jgi:hypothetical protein